MKREIDFSRDLQPERHRLYRLAMGILLDSAEAEDTVEDTLLRVWEESRSAAAKAIANLPAYLTTICRRLALDRAELKAAQTVELTPEIDAAEPASAETDTQERYQQALRLIHSLSEPQRSCVLLRDVEGMTYQQIAQALGLSEAQVKVSIHRGRTAVRQQMISSNRPINSD